MYLRRKYNWELDHWILWNDDYQDWEVNFGNKHLGEPLHVVAKCDTNWMFFVLDKMTYIHPFAIEEFINTLRDVGVLT